MWDRCHRGGGGGSRSIVSPKAGKKEEEDDVEFKTAEEHPERCEDFGEGGEKAEGFERICGAEGDPDVIHEAGSEAKRSFGIDAVEDKEGCSQDDKKSDDAEKSEDSERTFVVDVDVGNAEFSNAIWPIEDFKTMEDDFVEDVETRCFNTA